MYRRWESISLLQLLSVIFCVRELSSLISRVQTWLKLTSFYIKSHIHNSIRVATPPIMSAIRYSDMQIQAVVRASARHSMIVLNGSPGSGKCTVLQQAFPNLEIRRLESVITAANVDALTRYLQPVLKGCGIGYPIWAVGPAELISASAIPKIMTAMKSRNQRLILMTSEKVDHIIPKDAVVYFTGLDHNARVKLALEWGSKSRIDALKVVRLCGSNLRQLKFACSFGTAGVDITNHAWFDTKAILTGAKKQANFHNLDWLESNMLHDLSLSQLEGAANFYSDIAEMDGRKLPWDADAQELAASHGCENMDEEIIMRRIRVDNLVRVCKTLTIPRRAELQHDPRKWQKEMHAIHGNGSSVIDTTDVGSSLDLRSQLQRARANSDAPGPVTRKRGSNFTNEPAKKTRVAAPESVAPAPLPAPESVAEVPLPAPESVAEVPATLRAASTAVEPDVPSNVVLEAQPDASMEEDDAPGSETSYVNTYIASTRTGKLVFCPVHKVIEGEAPLLNIDPYVKATPNTTTRRMRWCAVVNFKAECTLADAWLQLSESLKTEENNYGMIMANAIHGGQKCQIAMIYKGVANADKFLKLGMQWNVLKVISKDPIPFAKALLRSPDLIHTIKLEEKSTKQKVSAEEAIQPFLSLDDLAFKNKLTNLQDMKSAGDTLTPEEEFMVRHSRAMEKIKELTAKKDRMRSMLKDVDSTLRFPWDFVITNDTVRVFHIDPNTLKNQVAQSPVDAIMDAVGLYTIVFFGPPGNGKTPAARALCALYSKSYGKRQFIETQTADSLRKLIENDLMEEGVGILLDEWRPRMETCGAQGSGIDHLKNMLDPSDSKTIEARFADFTMPESTAKFVTIQHLGKLVGAFANLTSETSERELRAEIGTDDDLKAILKRCMFVEVRGNMMKPELLTERVISRSRGAILRNLANSERLETDGDAL